MSLSKSTVAVLGGGGHGKVLIDLLKDCKISTPFHDEHYAKIWLFDDNYIKTLPHDNDELNDQYDDQYNFGEQKTKHTYVNGVMVRGSIEDKKYGTSCLVCAIGDNSVRKTVVDDIEKTVSTMIFWIRLVGKNTSISKTARIDIGTVVLNNVNIGPDVKIGKHCIINNGSNVDHDCVVGDFVHIAPGAVLCGGVKVGNGTLIGANATVIPGITIGDNLVIRAGSTVVKDIISKQDRDMYYKKK